MNSRKRVYTFCLCALAVLLVSGCSGQQIARAGQAVDQAKVVLAQTVAAINAAEKSLEVAKAAAAALGTDVADKIIGEAAAALATAKQALPLAQEAVKRSEDAYLSARKEQEAGGGTLSVIAAVVLAAMGGWGGAAALASRAIGKFKTALTLTASHADAMEAAETDADVFKAKDAAIELQKSMGVTGIIAAARGKI